jgi:hypothetical protein
MQTPTHECGHLPCTCQVPLEQSYCSDHCSVQAARGEDQGDCECEHAGCGESLLPAEEELQARA